MDCPNFKIERFFWWLMTLAPSCVVVPSKNITNGCRAVLKCPARRFFAGSGRQAICPGTFLSPGDLMTCFPIYPKLPGSVWVIYAGEWRVPRAKIWRNRATQRTKLDSRQNWTQALSSKTLALTSKVPDAGRFLLTSYCTV